MSDFLFIIPEGWTQLDWSYLSNNGFLSFPQAQDFLATNNMFTMEEILKAAEIIPQESSLLEAKLFNDELLIVRLG